MSLGRSFYSPKSPTQATSTSRSTSTSTSTTITKPTPYPKGLGLESLRPLRCCCSCWPLAVSCWLLASCCCCGCCCCSVVAAVVAAFGGASRHAGNGVSASGARAIEWWLLAVLLAISGPGKAGGTSRRLINIPIDTCHFE